MKKVYVTIPVSEQQKDHLTDIAAAHGGAEMIFASGKEMTPEKIAEADALIGNLPVPALAAAEKLQWMQLNSAGAAEYTAPGVLPENCVLTNSAGAYGTSVSEHMLALSFELIRHFGGYMRQQVKHEWKSLGRIISVKGSTIVVLGLGDIGGAYAKSVKALGAYVIGIRRTDRPKPEYLDEQYTSEHLDEVLGRADILAMVVPGVSETEHVMDEKRLRMMKPGSYIINVGRGNAIDPCALKKVLKEGYLGGAALDVTEPEPLPADDELWDMENCIITPHVAGQFYLRETFENIVRISGENLGHYLDGGEFTHVVDRKAGY